ncbi:MAG: Mur ligase family protein [Elusimicrobiota bacterium]
MSYPNSSRLAHGADSGRQRARYSSDPLLWLESSQETRWEFGLGRIRGLLSRLGEPQHGFRAVHVSGTNGKGTFCALLAAALRASGYRTGLYLSPHLADLRERIQVDGRPVSPAGLRRALEAVRTAERERATFFELLTAAAFHHFRESGVEVAVIETGLGGRLDATNVLEEPLLSVITSVGFDHVQLLGDTLAAIASEKAGILKRGSAALSGETAAEPLAAIRAKADELGCRVETPRARLRSVRTDWKAGRQELEDEKGARWTLALAGRAAARNAALVLDAARVLETRGLRLPKKALARAFSELRWAGRFQILTLKGRRRGKTLVLDGAHNPPALEAFLETWRESPFSRERATFMVGMLADKDHASMLARLAPAAPEFIAVRPPSPRALASAEVSRALAAGGGRALGRAADVRGALRLWLAKGAPVGVVCGSFYLVGGALRCLSEDFA